MSLSELDIIDRFFRAAGAVREDVVLGVGDDAALLEPRPGHCLVAASRTIQVPEHDAAIRDPAAIAHGVTAAAVTAVALQGGEPAWLTLALSLEEPDETWLGAFRQGLDRLCRAHDLAVVGGDTTRGPRRVTVLAHGQRPVAWPPPPPPRAGDLVYVVGELGGPGLALLDRHGELRLPRAAREAAYAALDFPAPPVATALALAGRGTGLATLEEGLGPALKDLLDPHGLGASLYPDSLPVAEPLIPSLDRVGGREFLVQAGSGLALAVVAGADDQGPVEAACARHGVPCAWVGMVEPRPGIRSHD